MKNSFPFAFSQKLKLLFSLVLLMAVIAMDQLLKFYVQSKLPKMCFFCDYPYGGVGIFKNIFGIQFSIVHATNKGAAWSLFSEHQEVLLAFRIALMIFLIAYAYRSSFGKTLLIPYILLIGGAFANILDYFTYGHVIDMFHFILWGYDYPVFNIADACIFIAVCWMAIAYVTEIKEGRSGEGSLS